MNKIDKDYNIYIGIVIQNNDPEFRGRVKIYIPELSPNDHINKNVDKFFNFLGTNNTDIPNFDDEITKLKNILPWAEYAGPIMGGNASGRFNCHTSNGTTSDTNSWTNTQLSEGFRPTNNLVGSMKISDAFTETNLHKNRFTNEYAYEYTPSNYSGLARGLFSIPNVGAHVYLFHVNGDRMHPVYFASAYGQEDIKRIYTLTQDINDNDSVDYPAGYENRKKSTEDDLRTFRSKTVLNSNKHTIELIDTDLREILKFTHYSGSFKEFNNYSNIELATNNDQKLVKGDQFSTVNLNSSEYVGYHKNTIIGGDYYLNVGETDVMVVKDILATLKEIHKYKLLFDVKRTKYDPSNAKVNYKDVSPLQTIQGQSGSEFGILHQNGFAQCPICGGKPYDPYDPEYGPKELMWKEAAQFGGLCMTVPSVGAETGEEAAKNAELVGFFESCKSFIYPGMPPPNPLAGCMPEVHPFEGKIGYYKGMKCACCGGTGWSKSTENGMFVKEPLKQPNGKMDQEYLSKLDKLVELQRKIGNGGEEVKIVSMNKIETIGLVMNDMKSFRVDPIGKLKIDGCHVAPQGTYNNFKPSPHVEYVDVDDIPGGDYNLTVMNKYKLLVGAKGVNIQTHGPLDIYGSIVNMTGEQMNISVKNELILDGGERVSMRARKISLIPIEHNAVVVEGQLHVTRNTILEGGLMVEGEIGLLHVTAPIEWQETDIGVYDIEPLCGPIIIKLAGEDVPIMIPQHTHYFKNIPITFAQHPEAVREDMITKGINSRQKIAAASVASNASACKGFNRLMPEFTKVAWEYAKQDAAKEGVRVNEGIWAQYDASYKTGNPTGGGPMAYTMNQCTSSSSTSGETSTKLKMYYFWKHDGDTTGYVVVQGTVNSTGELEGGITRSN